MALEISELMEMSLDDYIATSKSIAKNASKNDESKFKAERRNNSDEEEDTKYSQAFSIWKGPDSSTNYLDLENDDFEKVYKEQSQNQQQKKKGMYNNNQTGNRFDLRDRIYGNMEIPHVKSQQWRLMQPNINGARPAGMPPAVPINAPMVNRQMQWGGYQNNRRNRCNRNWANKRRNDRLNGVGGGYHNGLVQRNNTKPNNNNIKIIAGGFNRKHMTRSSRDLTIECLSDSNRMFPPPGDKTVNMSAPKSLCSNETAKSGDSLKSLIGLNDGDLHMKATLASKFLDYFQNRAQETIHKPIYDMQVQKEIHELQKKSLTYKCPGGEVVSSDGAGIDCTVVPSSSGISLNYRFA